MEVSPKPMTLAKKQRLRREMLKLKLQGLLTPEIQRMEEREFTMWLDETFQLNERPEA